MTDLTSRIDKMTDLTSRNDKYDRRSIIDRRDMQIRRTITKIDKLDKNDNWLIEMTKRTPQK